jgi:hypothetical protein
VEITLDLLIEDWLNDNQALKDHFKVFRYKDCENPSTWPSAYDNYIGMICDLGEFVFVIRDDYAYRQDAHRNKDGSVIIETKLYAADPEFFKTLACHLTIKHQRHHGPNQCKLYGPQDSTQSYQIVFDD